MRWGMKEFQNRNPLRQQADDMVSDQTVIERGANSSAGYRRNILGGFLFLLILVILLGGIVYHYSRFSFTSGEFVLLMEESGTVSGDQGNIQYERFLVRNRFPFVLTMTVRLCCIESDATSPRFFVLEKRYYSLAGTRSLYSGTYETPIGIVTSRDGRFHVTDRTGTPQELLDIAASEADESEKDLWLDEKQLPKNIHKTLRDAKLRHGKSYYWSCSLPGDSPDKILLFEITPLADYGR